MYNEVVAEIKSMLPIEEGLGNGLKSDERKSRQEFWRENWYQPQESSSSGEKVGISHNQSQVMYPSARESKGSIQSSTTYRLVPAHNRDFYFE